MKKLKELYRESNGIVDFEPLKKALDEAGLKRKVQCKDDHIVISFVKQKSQSGRYKAKKITIPVMKALVKLDEDLRLYYGGRPNISIYSDMIGIYPDFNLKSF